MTDPLKPVYFDNLTFKYNRCYPPLFFASPVTEEEEQYRLESLQRVSREYFRLGSKPENSHMTSMSNGMTLGEYAMQICVDRNTKRKYNKP
jgi:hypothetical protein